MFRKMYKKGFTSHYNFWQQPTQAYSNGFVISNHSNFYDILKITFDIVFFILCLLDQYRYLIIRGFDRSLLMNRCPTISINNTFFILGIIWFRKGNGDFIKQLNHFFKIYCCLPQIIIHE